MNWIEMVVIGTVIALMAGCGYDSDPHPDHAIYSKIHSEYFGELFDFSRIHVGIGDCPGGGNGCYYTNGDGFILARSEQQYNSCLLMMHEYSHAAMDHLGLPPDFNHEHPIFAETFDLCIVYNDIKDELSLIDPLVE